MDKVTFHYTLDSYVKADGTQSILLRITQNRKHKYVDIGYSIKAEDWNKEKKEVRKSHRLSNEIQMVMEARLIEAKKTYLKNLPITAREIKRTLKRELVGDSFLDYADQYIKNLSNGGTILSRESMINKLKEHPGKGRDGRQNDLLFPEVTYKFLKNYERYLKKIGNGVNTINGNIKFFKTVYNDALNSKHYRTMDNPWHEYKPLPKEKSQRTRLKVLQIEDIENYETKPGTRKHDAKNMFLFSFYMQGMRVKDVLQLTWKQIKKDHLYYKASKSKKARPRKIISKARAILEYYKQERTLSDDHIFPFLKGIDEKAYTATQFVKLIDSRNSQIRNELMRLAQDLGMWPDIPLPI